MHFHPFGRGMLPVSSNLPLRQRSEGLEGLPKSKGVPVCARVLARQITLSFCSVSILFFYCFVCAFPNQSWQAGWLQTISPPGLHRIGYRSFGLHPFREARERARARRSAVQMVDVLGPLFYGYTAVSVSGFANQMHR